MKIDVGMLVALLISPVVVLLSCFVADRAFATSLSKAAHNERRKLTANLFNGISVALFGTAIVGGYLQLDFFDPIHVATTQDLSNGVAICLALGSPISSHHYRHDRSADENNAGNGCADWHRGPTSRKLRKTRSVAPLQRSTYCIKSEACDG